MNVPPPSSPTPVLRGPRGPFAGFTTVFAWGLAHVVRWRKVFLVSAIGIALGILVGVQIRRAVDPAYALAEALDRGALAFGLPLIALILASDGFAYEVSRRTLVYHLVRPVSRTTLYLARFLAGWLVASLAGTLFLTALVASSGVAFPANAWLAVPVTATVGALALGAVFYLLSSLFKHGLVIGLIYAFVFEGFLSNVPGSMQKISVMFHVRSLFHGLLHGALPTVKPQTQETFIITQLDTIADSPATTALIVLVSVAVVALIFGAITVSRRDFGLRE